MEMEMGGVRMQVVMMALFCWVLLWAHPRNALATPDKILQDGSSCFPESWYVYSYASHCSVPARYFTEEFQLYESTTWSGLQPQWDEADATYYVRLAPNANSATYTMEYNRTDAPPGWAPEYVYQNFRSYLQNTETKRYLAWSPQQPSGQPPLLIETEDFQNAAFFLFGMDFTRPALPCIDIPGLRCHNYLVRALPAERVGQFPSGLLRYASESGMDYITVAAPSFRGDLPIVVTRVSTATADAAAAAASTVARAHATPSLIRLNA